MSEWMFNALAVMLVSGGVGLAAMLIARYRQGLEVGSRITPLSADDRLRVSLAMHSMELAERELAKATWVATPEGGHPGNPRIGDLLLELKSVHSSAIQLLRES